MSTETLIGSGPDLDTIKIGLDQIAFHESKHWFRERNGRLYSWARIEEKGGVFRLYLTGDPEPGIARNHNGGVTG